MKRTINIPKKGIIEVKKKFLGIYGAGGLSKEVYDVAILVNEKEKRWEDFFFIDDTKERGKHLGKECYPFEEACEIYNKDNAELFLAIGESSGRMKVADKIKKHGFHCANIIHPTVVLSPSVKMGEGIMIRHNSSISSDAEIGNNVYIQSNAAIGHDVKIADNVQISAGVIIAGSTEIGEATYVGMGALLKEEIVVGRESIISMGAVVMKDVADEVIVMGNPARVIAENKNKKVFKRA